MRWSSHISRGWDAHESHLIWLHLSFSPALLHCRMLRPQSEYKYLITASIPSATHAHFRFLFIPIEMPYLLSCHRFPRSVWIADMSFHPRLTGCHFALLISGLDGIELLTPVTAFEFEHFTACLPARFSPSASLLAPPFIVIILWLKKGSPRITTVPYVTRSHDPRARRRRSRGKNCHRKLPCSSS